MKLSENFTEKVLQCRSDDNNRYTSYGSTGQHCPIGPSLSLHFFVRALECPCDGKHHKTSCNNDFEVCDSILQIGRPLSRNEVA